MDKTEQRSFIKKVIDTNFASIKDVNKLNIKITNNLISYLNKYIDNTKSTTISMYHPLEKEVSLLGLINSFNKTNIKLVLPRVMEGTKILNFYIFDEKTFLQKNRLDIWEPLEKKEQILPNIIITPLLAFDKNCNRLGRGGGYFDATFKFLETKVNNLLKIGVAYSFQELEKIETDSWDIKLDTVISENKIFY